MLSRTEVANKPFLQFILIVCLCAISLILFSIIGLAIGLFNYELTLQKIEYMTDLNQRQVEGLKLMQLLSAIGLFLIPPLIYGMITSKKTFSKLSINQLGKPISYMLIFVLMIVSVPILSWIIEINAGMALPDFMGGIEDWMRLQESKAQNATNIFLTYNGIGSLIYILIIVAIVPAVGEELLFRGVLQKIFIQWTKNIHWGIWITAFLFSALHMQFFGFIPRMLMGAVFGYIFLWSKSLWLPILAHFINNASVVLLTYFTPEFMEDSEVSIFAESEYSYAYYFVSLVLTLGVIFLIRKLYKQKNGNNQELLNEL